MLFISGQVPRKPMLPGAQRQLGHSTVERGNAADAAAPPPSGLCVCTQPPG